MFVATGAASVGKTTTMAWIAQRTGQVLHGEAHRHVLATLGERSAGHPPDQGFSRIEDPNHFCPACHPRDFCEQVISHQQQVERTARLGDILDRGICDPIEFYLRHSGVALADLSRREVLDKWIDPRWQPQCTYARVFLFEVMPELQFARWGKSVEERIAEAQEIERRLAVLYRMMGHEVVRIPPAPVAERAAMVQALM